jgi:hypothetical protein
MISAYGTNQAATNRKSPGPAVKGDLDDPDSYLLPQVRGLRAQNSNLHTSWKNLYEPFGSKEKRPSFVIGKSRDTSGSGWPCEDESMVTKSGYISKGMKGTLSLDRIPVL